MKLISETNISKNLEWRTQIYQYSKQRVSWKQRPQRPLRPQNLKTKAPHIFGDPELRPAGRQCGWKLSVGDKNFVATFSIWGIGFVLTGKTLCFVSSKKLTLCLFEVFKVRLLLIASKIVVFHVMWSTFSAAMFSAISTASCTVGAWQKQVLCLGGFWKASYCGWRDVKRKCYVKYPN